MFTSGTSLELFDITCEVPQVSDSGPLLFELISMTLVLHLLNYHSHLLQMTPTYLRKIPQLIEITDEELSKLSLWFKAKGYHVLNITKPRQNNLFTLAKTKYVHVFLRTKKIKTLTFTFMAIKLKVMIKNSSF